MSRGGWLREVRRWACCGLRRTGGPSPGFGAFSSSPYTVPLCWVWGPGIAVLWSCQRVVRCVTVSACFTYLLLTPPGGLANKLPRESKLERAPVLLYSRSALDISAR